MIQNDQNQSLEVVEPSALESMERASIDVQITTARRFPRTLSTVKQQMLSFATLDVETAAGCFYTLPGRKGGDGKPIQGPSIRMAEIALSSFGNLRAGARVIADDGKQITAQGVCHDLQNNVCVSVEVKRRVTTKDGRRYSDDMIVTAGNAACSIALRNATFKVVPLALVKPVYEAAKRIAIGDGKTLVQRRAASMEHFAKLGVPKERIFAALEVKALEDIGLEHLDVLIGYANAIRDGETNVDDVFPDPKKAAASGPAGGILAATGAKQEAAANPSAGAKEAEVKAPAPQASATEQELDSAWTPERRAQLISEMEGKMLDNGVDEGRLWKYAKEGKHVPEGVDELWALPSDVLAKLAFAIPSLGRAAKNGGAK